MQAKCPECGEETEISNEALVRGYCDECDKKIRTCAECSKLVEGYSLYVVVEQGKEKRGHFDCLHE